MLAIAVRLSGRIPSRFPSAVPSPNSGSAMKTWSAVTVGLATTCALAVGTRANSGRQTTAATDAVSRRRDPLSAILRPLLTPRGLPGVIPSVGHCVKNPGSDERSRARVGDCRRGRDRRLAGRSSLPSAYGGSRANRRSSSRRSSSVTEPPALAGFLAGNFKVRRDAVPATLLDFCARGLAEIKRVDVNTYACELGDAPREHPHALRATRMGSPAQARQGRRRARTGAHDRTRRRVETVVEGIRQRGGRRLPGARPVARPVAATTRALEGAHRRRPRDPARARVRGGKRSTPT